MRVTTNGSCVTMIVKISAGSSGPRRRRRSRLRLVDGVRRRRTAGGAVAVVAIEASSPLLVSAVVGDRLGVALRGAQGAFDRFVAGEHGGELLRDLRAEVLELGDLDVRDAGVRHRGL